jgi:hypothetical protein
MLAGDMGDARLFASSLSQADGRPPGRSRPGMLILLTALLPLGCGHPASEAECRVILERIVELELKSQKVNDPAEIAKRRNESLGLAVDGGRSDLLDGCIGRHITDRALACVRNAETSAEVTEDCLQ